MIQKKIIETIILVAFATVLGCFCKQGVTIPDTEENNMPAFDFNILPAMQNGLSNEELLEYYEEDIQAVNMINRQIIIDYYDVDLNGDQQVDKIVHIGGSIYHSGSMGDALNILIKKDNGYYEVLSGIYRLFRQGDNEPLGEIYILDSVSEGFHDIRMISDGTEITLKYDGERYRHAEDGNNSAEQYYGKWKVVAYLPLNTTTVQQTTWHKEHYFGRTVEITEDSYTKSIYYWPCELDEHTFSYDYCEVADLDREDAWITRNVEELRWLEGDYLENETIRMLIFYKEGETYPEAYCAVSDDNKYLIVSWLSGDYLLERFEEQDSSINLEDLYGEWTITGLDSYDDAYEGREEDTKWVPEDYTAHLKFSDFYAPEWFGKKVVITENALNVASEITGNITKIEVEITNKENFERIQGIHDELSLTNEEIISYEIHYGEAEDVITVVPFNGNKMAIHIGLGWFIMEKDVEEEPAATLLNQPLFYDASIQGESSEINELAGAFGESVKGEFEVVLEGKEEFPADLVAMIEEALYDSLDYKTEYWLGDWERSADTPYYKILSELGAEEFYMDLEDIYEQFPELQSADVTFEDEYDAFRYLRGELCYNIFYIPMEGQRNRYVALVDSGGSAGGVEIQVCEWDGERLVTIYDASVYNPLCSRVIRYEDEYYYIFLHSNYGLKVKDGVQIFKLGEADFDGNLMIKYVTKEFAWENIYSMETAYSEDINSYLESMKETITSDEYLEGGQDKDISILRGDEVETYMFPLSREHKPYEGIDFANIGIPVYMGRFNYWPSNTISRWFLYADFYLWDEETDCMTELENLAINANQSSSASIVQMWFKKIDEKVFTFIISHTGSYNYVLDVLLIEGDEVTHIRRDLIAPKRGFVLYEGIDNFGVG